MIRPSFRLVLGGSLICALAAAQPANPPSDANVTGPTLGFTIDSAQLQLRPILGLPGAALLGPAAELPLQPRRLMLAPASRWLLAQEKDSKLWKALTGLTGTVAVQAQALPDSVLDADLVVFSTDGASAAFYTAGRQSVQVVRGLPDSPVLSRKVDLGSTPGLVSAMAVTSDGGTVLLAVTGDAGTLVLLSTDDAPPRQAATANRISALAFAPGGADAIWADADLNQLVLLRDVAGANETRVLATEADGVSGPIAVAADDSRYLAAMSNGHLLSLPRREGDPRQWDCGCAATTLSALPGGSFWRVNEGADSPLWVLDTLGSRLFFVPAGGSR